MIMINVGVDIVMIINSSLWPSMKHLRLCAEITKRRTHHRDTECAQRTTEIKLSERLVRRLVNSLRLMVAIATTLIAAVASTPCGAQYVRLNVVAIDRARILKAANQYLSEKPITITSSS